MIHVAVVEDEEKYREQLSEFLSRYGKERGFPYRPEFIVTELIFWMNMQVSLKLSCWTFA